MKIIRFIQRRMTVEDAKSPLGVLVLVAMVFLMVGVIAPVFSHPPSLPVPVPIVAQYTLPGDLVEVTDSPFSGIDPITHLPSVVETRSSKLRLYLVPPGIFMAGSNTGDQDERFGGQSTPAPVFISAFYISDAIPNELYERHDPSHRHHRGSYSGGNHADQLPATRVTWKQADSFMSWLAETEGVSTNAFRKPREMEYEKASHGGLDCCFPWGESVPASIKALYSPDRAIGVEEGEACGYGLHSPTANVFCWTEDWMGPYPNTLAALVNPRGPPTGKRKVLRGGTWWCYNLSFRCADRWEAFPDLADDRIGFRVVRDLPVPADMPVWTGRPSLAPRTATRLASLAVANISSNFCIEEAYRALQQRAQLVGFTRTWPDGSAGPAGEYPPNGFYCEDLANDPVPGTVATNLVQALYNQLSTEEMLESFVKDPGEVLLSHSTNSVPSITGLDTNNYLAPFHALADFIPELKTIPVTLPGVGITSVSGGPLTNMESRLVPGVPIFFPSCDLLTNAVTQAWLNTNWTHFAANAIGVHANIIVDQPVLTPPGPGMWRGNMKVVRGRLGRNLAVYPAGNWPVYASVSGTNTPNATPFPVDGQLHALGENALGGQIWVSSAKFADVGDTPPVFECIPTPTMVGKFFSFTGWDLGGAAAITFSFTNNVTGECQGCQGGPKIVFTNPSTTNLVTCVGITNILECVVSNGMTVVTDGEVKWEAPAALGSFSNNVDTVTLNAQGKARTAWIGTAPGTGEIKATGQNLKDPSDHTTALANVTTNIVATVVTFDGIKATLGGTNFVSMSSSTNFTANAPMAIPKKAGTFDLDVIGLNPDTTDTRKLIKFETTPKRNPQDVLAGNPPVLTPNATDSLKATLGTDAQGSFNVVAYCDVNKNGSRDPGEQFKILNVAIVRITLQQPPNQKTITTANKKLVVTPIKAGTIDALSVDVDPADQVAIFYDSPVLLEGGGSDKLIGVDHVTVGAIGSLTNDTRSVTYDNASLFRFKYDPSLPLLDTGHLNPELGGTNAFRLSSIELNRRTATTGGKIEDLHASDTPNFQFFKFFRQDQSPQALFTKGRLDFRDAAAAFSSDFPHSYTIQGILHWIMTFELEFKNGKWKDKKSEVKSDTDTIDTTGFPSSASDAGIITIPPRTFKAIKEDWVDP